MKLSKEEISYHAGRSAVIERENNVLAHRKNVADGNREFAAYQRLAAAQTRVKVRVLAPFSLGHDRIAQIGETIELPEFEAKSLVALRRVERFD